MRGRTHGPCHPPCICYAIPPSILFFWSNRGRYKTYAARESKTYPFGRGGGKAKRTPYVRGGVYRFTPAGLKPSVPSKIAFVKKKS